jgi:hypothetical protein
MQISAGNTTSDDESPALTVELQAREERGGSTIDRMRIDRLRHPKCT